MRVTSAEPEPQSHPHPRQKLAHWAGVVGSPAAWLVHLGTMYALVPFACAHGVLWPLYGVTALCLLLSVGGGAVAWTDWRRPWDRDTSDERAAERARFLGLVGAAAGVLFTLLILAQGAGTIAFGPCEK